MDRKSYASTTIEETPYTIISFLKFVFLPRYFAQMTLGVGIKPAYGVRHQYFPDILVHNNDKCYKKY